MRATSDSIRLQFNESDQPELVVTIKSPRREAQEAVTEFKQILARGKLLAVEIKQQRAGRSLDANAYCFVLCQKIAEALHTTKDGVYKRAIRDVGQFEIVPIRDDAVETWIERWDTKGLGWFAEVLEDSKLGGYKKVISYYGSSVYSTKEMSVLIDYIVSECKELGIDVISDSDKDLLIQEWGK